MAETGSEDESKYECSQRGDGITSPCAQIRRWSPGAHADYCPGSKKNDEIAKAREERARAAIGLVTDSAEVATPDTGTRSESDRAEQAG